MRANAVPGFLPTTHGLHFPNRFPRAPAFAIDLGFVHLGIGNAAYGFCGGMCFAVRDRFERGERVPPEVTPPAPGTPLFRELARRQLDSFDHLLRVPFRFWRMATAADAARVRRMSSVEWPAIRAEIDAGRLAVVGLVRAPTANPLRLGANHQVLAYGYTIGDGVLQLSLYDPNHPDRDDVTLRIERVDGSPERLRLRQSTGEEVFAVLALPYRAASRDRKPESAR